MQSEAVKKLNFCEELRKQNKTMEIQIKLIKKQFEDLTKQKNDFRIEYPKASNFYTVQTKLIENLQKHQESYQKEWEKLKSRIELLTSEYPQKLEKKIEKKQKKLEKLSEKNDQMNCKTVQKEVEKNFAKEIQTEYELKKYYENKTKESQKILLKNIELKKESLERLQNLKIKHKSLKSELHSINKKHVDSSKITKQSFIKENKNIDKELNRLKWTENNLRHNLINFRRKEKSLKRLLNEASIFITSPAPSGTNIGRSYSQPQSFVIQKNYFSAQSRKNSFVKVKKYIW